jgi:hypothetical protein
VSRPTDTPRDVATAADDEGKIHATDFEIHDVDPYDILRRMTHVFELRLRVRSLADATIIIENRSDVPRAV